MNRRDFIKKSLLAVPVLSVLPFVKLPKKEQHISNPVIKITTPRDGDYIVHNTKTGAWNFLTPNYKFKSNEVLLRATRDKNIFIAYSGV